MKRFLGVCLWIGLYGGLGWLVGKYVFGFDILSGDHWDVLFDKNLTAWPRHMAPRKLLCKVLLGFIIIGVLGIGIIWKRKRPAKGQPVFVDPKQINTSFAPMKMPPQGKIMTFQPAPVATPPITSAVENTVTPVAEAPNTFASIVKKISEEVAPFEASPFPHVKLENTFTHLIVSDDSVALLLKILTTSGEWQIQKTEDIAESLWTIAGSEPKKVMIDIINSTKTLARLEPDATCITVVLLTNGSFQNKEEVLEYFKSQNIRLATLLPDNARIEGIPTWQELLAEYYPEKQKDENVTENNDLQPQNVETV